MDQKWAFSDCRWLSPGRSLTPMRWKMHAWFGERVIRTKKGIETAQGLEALRDA